MANFATETEVRLKFQLNDTALVSAALIQDCIDDAHAEVLRYLDPEFDVAPVDSPLVLGEVLLAGACLFRALASKDAFEQKHVVIGGQRIEEGKRFEALMTISALCEKNAWRTLEPYLQSVPAQRAGDVTDTAPVLGEH